MTIVSSGSGVGRYPAVIGYTPGKTVTSFVGDILNIPRNRDSRHWAVPDARLRRLR